MICKGRDLSQPQCSFTDNLPFFLDEIDLVLGGLLSPGNRLRTNIDKLIASDIGHCDRQAIAHQLAASLSHSAMGRHPYDSLRVTFKHKRQRSPCSGQLPARGRCPFTAPLRAKFDGKAIDFQQILRATRRSGLQQSPELSAMYTIGPRRWSSMSSRNEHVAIVKDAEGPSMPGAHSVQVMVSKHPRAIDVHSALPSNSNTRSPDPMEGFLSICQINFGGWGLSAINCYFCHASAPIA